MTIQQINRKIQENNRLFKAATKAEKRVMIAKDALQSIKSKIYKARTGTWVKISRTQIEKITELSKEQQCNNSSSIQSAIIGLEDCQCCAVGSLMLSMFKYVNEAAVTLDDIPRGYEYRGPFSLEILKPSKTNLGIRKFFSLEQLKLIEFVYEGGDGWCDEIPTSIRIKFYKKYPNKTQRMIAILENIIENNGTFKL
jgi:hypothetical protein